MWNERTLEADIEYAAEMVREGLATTEQAAHACGIPLLALQAHLTGTRSLVTESKPQGVEALKGSISNGAEAPHDPVAAERADTQPAAAPQDRSEVPETTDYFVFYRADNRWVWKRVDQQGNVVKSCDISFQLYLDCVADARPHGFNGRPLFIFAASDIASLNAPDRPR